METDLPDTPTEPVRTGPVAELPRPVQGAPVHTGASRADAVQLRQASFTPGAPVHAAPVQPPPCTGAVHRPRPGARLGALVHRAGGALARTVARPDRVPVQTPARPAAPAAPGPVAPVQTAVPAPAPRRKSKPATSPATLGEQWGKLTADRGPWTVAGLRVLSALIVVALCGVVVAPPLLSAHDIINWAQSNSTDSGLGLSFGWAWVAFLALDFAAGVCVLICVYCAIVATKPGIFAWYVWAFAGATAYANHSFGTRPGAPGDAAWFFPVMSLLGPLLLHSVLGFLRKQVKRQQGNKRGQRPTFPLADWLPFWGTPQDTYGAWRTGAMLGLETPDAALWAYRAVSLDAGWIRRWGVRKLVRTEQTKALRARLEDPDVALAIPGLVPDGAFASLVHAPATDPVHPDDAAPLHAPVHQVAPVHAAPTPAALPRTGEPGAPSVHQAAPDAPGAPVRTAPGNAAPAGNVVQLDAASRNSALDALHRIYDAYGAGHTSWDDLTDDPKVSLTQIEKRLGIGKRRAAKALLHAETVLPWADAQTRSEGTA